MNKVVGRFFVRREIEKQDERLAYCQRNKTNHQQKKYNSFKGNDYISNEYSFEVQKVKHKEKLATEKTLQIAVKPD